MKVKYIRFDYSWGKITCKQAIIQKNNVFEFTVPHTPQQDGLCDRKSTTLRGKAHSMLNHAHLDFNLDKACGHNVPDWQHYWTEA
jgi:hypothetical protein